MNSADSPYLDGVDPDSLGGRLALLRPDQLQGRSLELYRRLSALVGPEAAEAGYRAQLEDGRLLGPFNAMLMNPALTEGLAQWIGQITAARIDPQIREAIILTIGQRWNAAFEIYAHTANARTAGLDEATIGALLAGQVPKHASRHVQLAHRLTLALITDHAVPDPLYQDLIRGFGVEQTISCLHLIGQYQFISSLLVLFDVPAPDHC